MPRLCKQCRAEIPPHAKSTTAYHKKKFCSFDCMVEYGKKVIEQNHKKQRIEANKARAEKNKQKKAEFDEMKKRVESQGSKSKLMQRAQAAFNAYIRERDKDLPCICCGTINPVSGGHIGAGGWDASHYRSRGASPELRFNEDNCFKGCVRCNRDLSGNVVNMRIGILKRIGQERLDAIEGYHEPKRYTADDLREIAALYKNKLKELKENNST